MAAFEPIEASHAAFGTASLGNHGTHLFIETGCFWPGRSQSRSSVLVIEVNRFCGFLSDGQVRHSISPLL